MKALEFENWRKENGGSIKDYYVNRISYKFVTMNDNWIAIFEYDHVRGEYIPLIQAKDIEHAESFCFMREPVPVPVERI